MNVGLFAVKSFGRTPLRSALQVVGMATITAVMLIWGSLNNGMQDLMMLAATSLDVGEWQIHAPGYLTNPDLYATVANGDQVLAALRAKSLAASRRLYGFALVAVGDQSLGTQVRGVDLDHESEVTNIATHLEDGAWLSADKRHEVVVGRVLAHRLKLKVGQDLVLVTQAADGSTANALFRVRGILRPASVEIDSRAVYMGEAGFREFYQMPQGAHEIAVKRLDQAQPTHAARTLIEAAAQRNEVKSWRQIKPLLAQGIDLMGLVSTLILAFVYLSLGGLIINITFMTIDGRITEFGTMTALGMPPWKVVGLILAEACCVAAASSVVAWAIGVPTAFWLRQHGLDLRWLFEQYSWVGINLEPMLFARVGVMELTMPILFMVASILLFSLYPSVNAARMVPIKALLQR